MGHRGRMDSVFDKTGFGLGTSGRHLEEQMRVDNRPEDHCSHYGKDTVGASDGRIGKGC